MLPNIDFNRLRMFEAAARHESFTRAAKELNVSQPAVSQQVRALEEQLRIQLFTRGARTLRLTDEGARLSQVVSEAMATLTDGLVRAVAREPEGDLRISCLPAFATFWLAPRLHRFAGIFPKLNVQLLSQSSIADLRTTNIDVGIRWGQGPWPNTASTLLFRESYIPVCAPQLANAVRSKLDDMVVLYDLAQSEKLWRDWSGGANVHLPTNLRSIGFETTADLVAAAQAGAGVALVREGLTREAFSSGRLVSPWDHRLSSQNGYYLVHAPARSEEPKVVAFSDWIKQEVDDVS